MPAGLVAVDRLLTPLSLHLLHPFARIVFKLLSALIFTPLRGSPFLTARFLVSVVVRRLSAMESMWL